MATIEYTPFSNVYTSFLSKITDDMYMELTSEDTYKILRQLLISAIPKFEFPKCSLNYDLIEITDDEQQGNNGEEEHHKFDEGFAFWVGILFYLIT